MRIFTCWMLLCIGSSGASWAVEQDHSLEFARRFPPELCQASYAHLAGIDWQLRQRELLLEKFRQENKKMESRNLQMVEQLKALMGQLPEEVRFVDSEGRSRLVSKAMEELLNVRLDLATQEKSRETLALLLKEKSSNDAELLHQKQRELAGKVAAMKLQIAQTDVEKAKALASQGAGTEQDVEQARHRYSYALLAHEAAALKAEIDRKQERADAAHALTKARVDSASTGVRIEAARKFLNLITASTDIVTQIEKIKRDLEDLHEDRRVLAAELARINREMEELNVLKSLIKEDVDAIKAEQQEAEDK